MTCFLTWPWAETRRRSCVATRKTHDRSLTPIGSWMMVDGTRSMKDTIYISVSGFGVSDERFGDIDPPSSGVYLFLLSFFLYRLGLRTDWRLSDPGIHRGLSCITQVPSVRVKIKVAFIHSTLPEQLPAGPARVSTILFRALAGSYKKNRPLPM